MRLLPTLARLALAAVSVRLCRLADGIEREPPAVDPAVDYPAGTLGAERKALAKRLRETAAKLGG